jgi:hypothetical protein
MTQHAYDIAGRIHYRRRMPNPDGGWKAICTCNQWGPLTGSANGLANEWDTHIHSEAAAHNTHPVKVPPPRIKANR